ncbi:alpha-ribazole phosphatase [Dictyobacter vulcani]|uniref:Alpha-ribazole phosphatase n=1 Tax=Dictyobacter vulcani TaxID=2607529 RepID=A0A5J4KJD3_9CHLR|nr:histidine phosphatase family protein [Dictyobacter vulcani]GER86440.1 alpha-ribazole phosphatase [Dictyobacter vulcani]
MTDRLPSASSDEPSGVETQLRRLWLVRHGVTTWNSERRFCGQSDPVLSSEGEKQAQAVGLELSQRVIAAVYTSNLQRAVQTAAIIGKYQQTAPSMRLSGAWSELFFGAWEGLTYTEIATRYPDQLDFFTNPMQASPVDGESLLVLIERVRTAFIQMVRDAVSFPAGDIVLVSHGGALRVLICLVLGMPFERQWQVKLDHCSLSAIDFVVGCEDVFSTTSLTLLNQPVGMSSACTYDMKKNEEGAAQDA